MSEIVDKQDLPDFVMIPKYRSSYIIDNVDYICQVLNNQFEFGNDSIYDQELCKIANDTKRIIKAQIMGKDIVKVIR